MFSVRHWPARISTDKISRASDVYAAAMTGVLTKGGGEVTYLFCGVHARISRNCGISYGGTEQNANFEY